MNGRRIRLINLGRYGMAIAWLRRGKEPVIRRLEVNEKNGTMWTVTPTVDLIERVLQVLRRQA